MFARPIDEIVVNRNEVIGLIHKVNQMNEFIHDNYLPTVAYHVYTLNEII
jgi:hypothetical protein